MSLNVKSGIENYKINVLYSSVCEIISLVNVLANTKHHAFAEEEIVSLGKSISKESREFLQIVSYLPFQGLEFFEILLDLKIYNNLKEFTDAIKKYDNIKFIKTFTGEELDEDRIKNIISNKNELNKFINDLPWVYRGKKSVFECLLYDTDSFKNSFIRLIYEINDLFFDSKEAKFKLQYKNAVNDIKLSLSKMTPHALGEEIMNKKIPYDDSIEEYVFLPSYYISPHYLMAYNRTSRMFLYDMRKNSTNKNKSKEDLTKSLKILSDETRLEILRLLILQPSYGKQLSNRLNLTTATISHHLELLSSVNLINVNRDKNTKYICANEEEIEKLISKLKNYLYNK